MIRAGATITPAPQLTLDDLEALAFRYGGVIERNVVAGTCTLVGAVVAGVRVNFEVLATHGRHTSWSRVDAVEVLSEGVTTP